MINLNDVKMIDTNTFATQVRGSDVTLMKRDNSGWTVFWVNGSVRAYRRGFAAGKDFASLEAIENHYRSLRGIAGAILCLAQPTCNTVQ